MNDAEKYIADVLSGKKVVCKYVRLAVERHINDLKTGLDRGLEFKKKEGEKAIRFFSKLRQSKGEQFKGKPLKLEPWQAFIIYSIYGWYQADGRRRFSYAYIEVPKKNGKTTLAAGIGIKHLGFDGESRPEVYTVAKDRGQARICFDEAQSMIKETPGLSEYLTVYRHNIHCDYNGGKMEPLSKDSDKKEGLGATCVINDEYHLQIDNQIYNNLTSGMMARRQPLFFTITTAGFNTQSPCYLERKVCIDILEGRKQQDDKFAIIYTIDEDDDWKDPDVWIKANPNYGISVDPVRLKSEFQEAINNPSKIPSFKTKHLCVWTNARENFIKDEDWKECNFEIYREKLKGKDCIAAIDLAATTDLNAMVLLFPEGHTGVPDILPFFWIPEKKMKEKSDHVDYIQWVNDGYMIMHEGEVIDIDRQAAEIMDILKNYNVLAIKADPWRINERIGLILQNSGLVITGYGQKHQDMDPPTRELERMILTRKINHGGNPVLRWMNSNVAIDTNYEGFIKIVKNKSIERVDGMVALVMAIGGWMQLQYSNDDLANQIYKNNGIETL